LEARIGRGRRSSQCLQANQWQLNGAGKPYRRIPFLSI
jgi:hypothetical protein